MDPIDQYLENGAEPEAALADQIDDSVGHAIQIAAYGETDDLFETLASVPGGPLGEVLIVVVLNARRDSPEEVHQANGIAREKITALGSGSKVFSEAPDARLLTLPRGRLLLIDRAKPGHYLPPGQGIGLARKIGCDLVAALARSGRVASPWIHVTDADVRLPNDYFEQVRELDPTVTAAAVYSFEHRFPEDDDLARAGRIYEISLRYNVLGLAWAGSPYAYESLGSCLAISPWGYGRVRGFPRVNAIEDFTILNDLAKIGSIARLGGSPIALEGRISSRVPISTGQALSRIVEKKAADGFELYHPIVFAHLAAWLRVLAAIARRGGDLAVPLEELPRGNPFFRADLLQDALEEMGAFAAVRETIEQPLGEDETLRRLNEWFDAFRTRRLLDDLRDAGLVSLPLREALSEAPFTGLTAETEDDLEVLRFLLAEEEKKLAASAAGVPVLELDRA